MYSTFSVPKLSIKSAWPYFTNFCQFVNGKYYYAELLLRAKTMNIFWLLHLTSKPVWGFKQLTASLLSTYCMASWFQGWNKYLFFSGNSSQHCMFAKYQIETKYSRSYSCNIEISAHFSRICQMAFLSTLHGLRRNFITLTSF